LEIEGSYVYILLKDHFFYLLKHRNKKLLEEKTISVLYFNGNCYTRDANSEFQAVTAANGTIR